MEKELLFCFCGRTSVVTHVTLSEPIVRKHLCDVHHFYPDWKDGDEITPHIRYLLDPTQ
jgi:hypothetical protein